MEAPGVSSTALTDAIGRFNAVGSCVLVHGWAQDIGRLLREPVDVISAAQTVAVVSVPGMGDDVRGR